MVGNKMKITKTYLKQLIKEELNNLVEAEENEEFKPGSPKFKEILEFLRYGRAWKINPAEGAVSTDGQTITFSTYPHSYIVKANINNPSNGLVITNKITGKTFEDINKTPKLMNLLGELNSDKLKVIAWIQNSLYKNKNTAFLKQLGWLP